jgi:selenocysteine-specific elongation factor
MIEPRRLAARIRVIQTLGEQVEEIGPGNRVALNLAGVDRDRIERGDCVVTQGRWMSTDRLDASLEVLASLDHAVSRRGAYLAYVGSRELPVDLRVLGSQSLAPGTRGPVRLFLPVALPLLPGDRFVVRETGRDETVGGGRVLDIAPVMRASKASPDGTLERAVAERGWVDVDELELLTGVTVEPSVGRWVTTPSELESVRVRIAQALATAGQHGLDLAALDDHERAVLATLDGISVEGGRARPVEAADPYADNPLAAAIRAGGFAPETPAGADRATIRELTRRGILVERERLLFHRDSVDAAAAIAAEMLAETPSGFTVAGFRERTGTTRKFALPLLAELDARGVTRRRDDLRIAGPRLPG